MISRRKLQAPENSETKGATLGRATRGDYPAAAAAAAARRKAVDRDKPQGARRRRQESMPLFLSREAAALARRRRRRRACTFSFFIARASAAAEGKILRSALIAERFVCRGFLEFSAGWSSLRVVDVANEQRAVWRNVLCVECVFCGRGISCN